MTTSSALDRAVRRVVDSGNCSGCGACTLLDDGLQMRLDKDGFSRPIRVSPNPRSDAQDSRTFGRICPGRTVRAPKTDLRRHATMGSYVSVWRGWAVDAEIRFRGSSGGVLTALAAWLVESGQATAVSGVAASEGTPRRTVPIEIGSRDEALSASGSRYAPVSAAVGRALVQPSIGKPCETSALRALWPMTADGSTGATEPIRMSFFCAGTPSQRATDRLLDHLDVPPAEPLQDMWYRGRGWPGAFTAVTADRTAEASYNQSWGEFLGPTMQWRCKICPDGVGESSDVTAADLWHADDAGYPSFVEGAGVSAIIARTERGHELIEAARRAGVLVVEPSVSMRSPTSSPSSGVDVNNSLRGCSARCWRGEVSRATAASG